MPSFPIPSCLGSQEGSGLAFGLAGSWDIGKGLLAVCGLLWGFWRAWAGAGWLN
jgi:hypothetical protein